jgi:flagellar hook protein FlgE
MASFSIALSGLTAASSDLDVTANNIANADTIGFKGSRAEFADVYATGAASIGEGVRLAATSQQFTQGNISTSSSNLDMAISGNGFFTLASPNGIEYTRNGEFSESSTGNVVSSTGQALQVYPPLLNGGFNTGTTTDLNLQSAQSAPAPTTSGAVTLNLPADSTAPILGTFDPTNSNTYTESTSTQVYDSLGNAYSATLYFINDAAPAVGATPAVTNTWSVNMVVNGVTYPGSTMGTTANPTGTATPLTFGSNGLVSTPTAGAIWFNGFDPAGSGGSTNNLNFDFANTTQFGGSFGVTSITQNGFATGQLSTVAIDPTGIVSAVYTNGRSTQLGQLAMANFPNPQGLEQLGDTNWSETYSSGTVVQGTASSAGFGTIQAGALEASNVDLTTELVNMITAQRAFDANAQVITTANQESQTVIQIDR